MITDVREEADSWRKKGALKMGHRWLLTAFILTVFIAFIITGCGSFIKRASAEKRSVNKDMEDNKYAGTKQTFGSEQTFGVETNRTIDTEKADAKAVAQRVAYLTRDPFIWLLHHSLMLLR